jgi:Uncharacterized protein conserved in bacteria (DUF2320).
MASACYASVPVGDNAEIFLTGTLGVRSDSNIFLAGRSQTAGGASAQDKDDVVFEVNPGVQLVFGKNSLVQGTLNVSESFTKYSENDELDDELASVSLNTRYDDGKSKLSFNASFTELNQNTVDTLPAPAAPVNALILRDVFSVGAVGEVSATEKSSISVGIQYRQTEFERRNFSDSEVVTVPVNYYYEFTPKVDLSLGYRYRNRAESIGFDTEDHFFNVGARGEFTPKLTGQFAVGLTQRSFSHKARVRDDETMFGVDSSLTYSASPKTSILLGLSNDFDTNSQGNQQRNFAVRLASTTAISAEFSVTASVAYRSIDYYQATPSRIDDYFEGHIGATYTMNEHVSFSGVYSYRTNKSDLPSSDFTGNVVSFAANFRF